MKKITGISILLLLIISNCKTQGQWEKFALRNARGYYATSSELDEVDPFEGLGKYGGFNLFDRNPATAWVEGVDGDGNGKMQQAGILTTIIFYKFALNKNRCQKFLNISVFCFFSTQMSRNQSMFTAGRENLKVKQYS